MPASNEFDRHIETGPSWDDLPKPEGFPESKVETVMSDLAERIKEGGGRYSKAHSPPGPWQHEPDGPLQWYDEQTGLPCLMQRSPMGTWCGYVGMFEDHAAFGLHYDDERLLDCEVHGGLTFSDPHREAFVREPGDDRDMWWLGFDTGHACDVYPMYPELSVGGTATYRDEGYVREQCARLAEFLHLMPNPRRKQLPELDVE